MHCASCLVIGTLSFIGYTVYLFVLGPASASLMLVLTPVPYQADINGYILVLMQKEHPLVLFGLDRALLKS